MLLVNAPSELQRIVVLTLAIPTATMPTSLAIQFKVNEAELASTQFLEHRLFIRYPSSILSRTELI